LQGKKLSVLLSKSEVNQDGEGKMDVCVSVTWIEEEHSQKFDENDDGRGTWKKRAWLCARPAGGRSV
jgi:hypothetical protein